MPRFFPRPPRDLPRQFVREHHMAVGRVVDVALDIGADDVDVRFVQHEDRRRVVNDYPLCFLELGLGLRPIGTGDGVGVVDRLVVGGVRVVTEVVVWLRKDSSLRAVLLDAALPNPEPDSAPVWAFFLPSVPAFEC